MITLYQRADCPFCWKVRLALAELGLGYTTIELMYGEKHPDVLRLSPTGTVPVLVDGDCTVWESAVALDYLDARYSVGSLLPADSLEQTWVRSLQAYSDKCIGAALRPLVFEKRSKDPSEQDSALIETSALAWRNCQAWLEDTLQRRWMGGCSLSAGECALAARCGVASAYGVPVSPDFPVLFSWFETVQWRPAWDAAYPSDFLFVDQARLAC
jgi:glutathione S-transferase